MCQHPLQPYAHTLPQRRCLCSSSHNVSWGMQSILYKLRDCLRSSRHVGIAVHCLGCQRLAARRCQGTGVQGAVNAAQTLHAWKGRVKRLGICV